jgi:hypothetical protein
MTVPFGGSVFQVWFAIESGSDTGVFDTGKGQNRSHP